jgi:hypothetical protein
MANIYRSITTGVVALATSGIALSFAGAAQAQLLGPNSFNGNVGQVNTPGFFVQVGDKIFSDFSITGSTVEATDSIQISFEPIVGQFQVNLNAAGGQFTSFSTPGSLNYNVTIAPGFTNTFAAARTDAQGSGIYSKSLATTLTSSPIFATQAGASSIVSFNPLGQTSIAVDSDWTFPGIGILNSVSDQFTQDPLQPQPPTGVPEPSAVLGMLALGLAGFARRNKA